MVKPGASDGRLVCLCRTGPSWSDYLSIVEFDLEFRCVLPLKRTNWRQRRRGTYKERERSSIFHLVIAQS